MITTEQIVDADRESMCSAGGKCSLSVEDRVALELSIGRYIRAIRDLDSASNRMALEKDAISCKVGPSTFVARLDGKCYLVANRNGKLRVDEVEML